MRVPELNSIINNPSWLRVENATTFFRSESIKAVQDPTIRVIKPSHQLILLLINQTQLNFIIRNKPAVTKVLLWTRDEIGVGAAIADGSHEINGNWALFVQMAKEIRINIDILNDIKMKFCWSQYINLHNSAISPIRFVIAVKILPLIAVQLL
jgi:hypothetical protein